MKKSILLAIVIALGATATARAGGQDVWTQSCAKCHGTDGTGQTNMGKRLGCRDYTDAKVQASVSDADAITAVKSGFKNSDGKTVMKAYDSLSDDDVKAVVAYLRTLKK
jgi:mono/diheme cytochrome c family protein